MSRLLSRMRAPFFMAISVTLSLVQAQWVSGAAAPASPLTLAGAVKMGLAGNPGIRVAMSMLHATEAKVSQARSGFLPQVDITETFNRTNNPMWAFGTKLNQEIITSADFDPARLNDPGTVDNFSTALSVTLPVYDRGRIRSGLNQARLNKEATSQSERRTRQQVIVEVVVSYLGVLLAQEQLKVVEKTLDTARANYEMVSSRFRSGLVVKSDFLRAKVRIAELEQELLKARSKVEIARASLNGAMGVQIGRIFRLVTPLEKGKKVPGTLDTWITRSLRNRPDLQEILYREKMAKEEVRKARAAHLPGLYLSASYEVNSEDFSKTANSYTLGATMRLNLFSGFRLKWKTEEAMANLSRVQAMTRRMKLGIKVQTRQAYLMARSAYERIKVAKEAVGQAEEGLRIVRNRYESGLFTIVNLLDGEVALQQARTNHLRALHDFRVAMARLSLSAGTVGEDFQ